MTADLTWAGASPTPNLTPTLPVLTTPSWVLPEETPAGLFRAAGENPGADAPPRAIASATGGREARGTTRQRCCEAGPVRVSGVPCCQ